MRRLLPLLMLAGCAGTQTPLAPAGAQAGHILSLLQLLLGVCGAMYVAVLVFLGWGVLRRRRSRPMGEPAVEPDDRRLSRSLAVWCVVVVAGLTLLSVGSFVAERRLAEARAQEELVVEVTGHQWWWRIRYRDPAGGGWIETANELHLPTGRTARIELGAADVIHSFWIPTSPARWI